MEIRFNRRTPLILEDMRWEMAKILKLIFRLMIDRRIPLGLKLILPVALIYLISPLDIVPDILPVLGRIDDILVIFIATAIFLGLSPRKILIEHFRGTTVTGKTPNRKDKVIDGQYRSIENEEDDEYTTK